MIALGFKGLCYFKLAQSKMRHRLIGLETLPPCMHRPARRRPAPGDPAQGSHPDHALDPDLASRPRGGLAGWQDRPAHARMAMSARERRWQALMQPGASMAKPQGLVPSPNGITAWRASGLARPSTSGGRSLTALPASGPGQGRGWPPRPSTAPSAASDGPQRWRAPEGSQSIARASSTRTSMQDKNHGHERATTSEGGAGRDSTHGARGRASALQGGADGESGDNCEPLAGRQRPWSASGASARRSPSSSAAGTPMSGFSPRVSRFRPSTAPSVAAGSPSEPRHGLEHAEWESKGVEPGSGLRTGAAPHKGGQAEERPGRDGCREGLVLATSYGTATSQSLPHARPLRARGAPKSIAADCRSRAVNQTAELWHARPLRARGAPKSIAADCRSRAVNQTAELWPAGSQHVQQPGNAARAVPLERNYSTTDEANALPGPCKPAHCVSADIRLPAQDSAPHEAGVACEGAGDQRRSVATRRWRPSSAAVPASGRPTLDPSSMELNQAHSPRATAGAPERVATAPAALGAALGVPAGVRLARPGSGGSPTSRREHSHEGRLTWHPRACALDKLPAS